MNNIQLTYQLRLLNKTLTHEKETSPGQVRIIQFLKIHDGISTKELAHVLNIKVPSLNEVLNKLENKGLIYKEVSPEDKRILLIKLTKEGKTCKFKAPKNVDIFNCLDKEEREQFENTLIKLNKEMLNNCKKENPEKFKEMEEKRKEIYEKYFKGRNFSFDDVFEE